MAASSMDRQLEKSHLELTIIPPLEIHVSAAVQFCNENSLSTAEVPELSLHF